MGSQAGLNTTSGYDNLFLGYQTGNKTTTGYANAFVGAWLVQHHGLRHRKLGALIGQTTSDFLRTIRLKRAAQLLEAQSGNVSEIAYSVGFSSLSYFSKSCRDHFGIQPTEYALRHASSAQE